jgi:hypothetical protein
MAKWSVWFTETNHYKAEVEATTKQEAIEKALAMDRAELHCEQEPDLDISASKVKVTPIPLVRTGGCGMWSLANWPTRKGGEDGP